MYYTIQGIEDDKFPQDHPDVIKFFDYKSAQDFLDSERRMGCPGLENCYVSQFVEPKVPWHSKLMTAIGTAIGNAKFGG